MTSRRAGIRLTLTLAASALLAACAVEPPKPAPRPATVIPRPAPPPTIITQLVPAIAKGEPWTSLTASFVLDDCATSSLIHAKERMYTRYPDRFERLLRQSLPLMMYVQKQLHAAGIPGEFAMLPMLESSYNPAEPSVHGDAAGMWQLMPYTARRHGVHVDHGYDGRRDPIASTRAAIKMLKSLDQQFGNWRLVDMAYNAGPQAIVVALRRHPSLGHSAIPDIPVSRTTRNHLAKLMALSCILREPARFHVQLPKPTQADELTVTQVPAGTSLAEAANMAEIPEARLHALNPGYISRTIPRRSPHDLLLPASAALSLTAALTVDGSESVAQVSNPEQSFGPSGNIPLPDEPSPPQDDNDDPAPAPTAQIRQHRVRKGETLWSIAHRYDVSVRDLKRWNHLDSSNIRPGEELRVQG